MEPKRRDAFRLDTPTQGLESCDVEHRDAIGHDVCIPTPDFDAPILPTQTQDYV
jgi:hypothetical protein